MNEGQVAGRVPFGRLFLGNFEGYLKIARDEAARLKLTQELADQAAGAKMPGQVAGNDWTSLSAAARRATALKGYRRGRGPAADGLPVEPRMDGVDKDARMQGCNKPNPPHYPLCPLTHGWRLSALQPLAPKTQYPRMRGNVKSLGLEIPHPPTRPEALGRRPWGLCAASYLPCSGTMRAAVGADGPTVDCKVIPPVSLVLPATGSPCPSAQAVRLLVLRLILNQDSPDRS